MKMMVLRIQRVLASGVLSILAPELCVEVGKLHVYTWVTSCVGRANARSIGLLFIGRLFRILQPQDQAHTSNGFVHTPLHTLQHA